MPKWQVGIISQPFEEIKRMFTCEGHSVGTAAKLLGVSRQTLSYYLGQNGTSAPELKEIYRKTHPPKKKDRAYREPLTKSILFHITEEQWIKIRESPGFTAKFRRWIERLPAGGKNPTHRDPRNRKEAFVQKWMGQVTERQHAKTRTIPQFRQKFRDWVDSLD